MLTTSLDLSRICPGFKTGIPGADPPAGFDLPEVGSEGHRSGNSPHKDHCRTVFRAPGVLGGIPLVPRAGPEFGFTGDLLRWLSLPWNCRAGSCQEPAFRLSWAPHGKPRPATAGIMRSRYQIAEHG